MEIIRNTIENSIFPYIAYIPDNIGPNPGMILFLHGAGERGNGTDELDKVLKLGMPKIATDDNLKNHILVMPQCPRNTFWVAKLESLKRFIDQIIEQYRVNTRRVYLCGLSMGGYGTWYLAMAYPDLFAAIAPCCGGGMAWNAAVLKMPIWAFHGRKDASVSVNQTLEMAERLQNTNPNFRCTIYEDVAHNAWNQAFSDELLQWLLAQEK